MALTHRNPVLGMKGIYGKLSKMYGFYTPLVHFNTLVLIHCQDIVDKIQWRGCFLRARDNHRWLSKEQG